MLKTLYSKFLPYLFLGVITALWAGPVWATPIGSLDGTPIILIDGDADGDTSVTLVNVGTSPSLTFGYHLNGSSIFTPFSLFDTFSDRDILDLALSDGSTVYTASGDLADASYRLEMDFGGEVGAPFSSQAPLPHWLDRYYSSLTVTWHLPSDVSTSMNFAMTPGDGMAPVPEPGTIILMGSGLAGLGFWRWRRSEKG
ncbi:MAG: PEP-CTERM sorting domain-containing protein [Nitrospiria bacterium]